MLNLCGFIYLKTARGKFQKGELSPYLLTSDFRFVDLMLVIVTIVHVRYRVIIRDQAMEMSDLEGIKRKNWS